MNACHFSFYGVNLALDSGHEQLAADIRRHFSFFESNPNNPHITIKAACTHPPCDDLPPMKASYLTSRNACYGHKGKKYIDYSGKALVVYDRNDSICDILGSQYDLLYEICYTTIISLISDKLSDLGTHRIHAFGLSVKDNRTVLLLLDMGGGKTALAMDIINSDKDIKLLSEDSPLIQRNGDILPFPIRIGVKPGEVPPEIPKDYQRVAQRGEFGPKILLDIEYFKGKLCTVSYSPYMLLVGKRVLGMPSAIRPASKYRALKECIKNSVVGMGLYQGIECVFQEDPWEILRKIPLGLSRLNSSIRLISRSTVYEFSLGLIRKKMEGYCWIY